MGIDLTNGDMSEDEDRLRFIAGWQSEQSEQYDSAPDEGDDGR